MSLLLAALVGLAIGAVLGGLGGGGAVLTVPVLVYLFGQSAQEATTGSLLIVGVTAVIGALGHARAGNVRWRVGAAFGGAGVLAAYAGTLLNRRLDEDLLLLGFALVMVLAAGAMLRQGEPRPRHRSRAATVAYVALTGLGVGFLTGLFGVGGGFVIVPALVLALRLPMPVAVGTSLVVISIVSAASLASRADDLDLDWAVIAPFTAAAVAGTFAGQRIGERVSGPTLTRAFAVLLLLVAAFVGVHSAVSLA